MSLPYVEQESDPFYRTILFTPQENEPFRAALPLNSSKSQLEAVTNSRSHKEEVARWRFGRDLNPILAEGSGFEGHICFLDPQAMVNFIVDKGLWSLNDVMRQSSLRDPLRRIKKFVYDPDHPIDGADLALELNTQFAIMLAFFRATRDTSHSQLALDYQSFIARMANAYAGLTNYSLLDHHDGTVGLAVEHPTLAQTPLLAAPPLPFGPNDGALRTARQLKDDELLAWDYMMNIGRIALPAFQLAVSNSGDDVIQGMQNRSYYARQV